MATGGCLKVAYSGAAASCLLVGDASAKTLTAKTGTAGSESVDAAFGTAGVVDLTATTADTLAELATLISTYTGYAATVQFGDDIPTQYIVSQTVQAAGGYAYVLFDYASSVLSTYALTTWARVKELIPSLLDSDQTICERLINKITAEAEKIAHRKIAARTYSATGADPHDFDGDGTDYLIFPTFPINSVSHIYIDSARAFGSDTEVASTDYVFYPETGIIRLDGLTFTEGIRNVRVDLNAGMTTVDDDVQAAVAECVSVNLKRYRGSGIGVRSISSPDGTNVTPEPDIPPSAYRIFESLRGYRS